MQHTIFPTFCIPRFNELQPQKVPSIFGWFRSFDRLIEQNNWWTRFVQDNKVQNWKIEGVIIDDGTRLSAWGKYMKTPSNTCNLLQLFFA